MTPLESSQREAFESGVNQACLRLHVEGVNSSMWNTFVPGLTFRIMAGEIWHEPSLCYFTICALCIGNILEIVPGPDLRPRYRLGRIVCAEQTDRDGTGNSWNGTEPSVRRPEVGRFPAILAMCK